MKMQPLGHVFMSGLKEKWGQGVGEIPQEGVRKHSRHEERDPVVVFLV